MHKGGFVMAQIDRWLRALLMTLCDLHRSAERDALYVAFVELPSAEQDVIEKWVKEAQRIAKDGLV